MKKLLFLGLLSVAVLAPQSIKAANTPFTFTAKIAQPAEGANIKTGSSVNLFVKVAPPQTGTGYKTSFIVTWPDKSSQIVSTNSLDLDVTKVITGPAGPGKISVYVVMNQPGSGNSYVSTQTLEVKLNIEAGPLSIAKALPPESKRLSSGAAQTFSVQVSGGQAPYNVTWSFPDGKSAKATANAQGLATASWTPKGPSGKQLVLVAVTDGTKKTVLDNQYVIVSTASNPAKFHDADLNKDYRIDPNELAYTTRLYQAKTGSYGCSTVPGEHVADSTNHSCKPFSGDINKDWKLDIDELNRVIQFYNSGGYKAQNGTEDGFAPIPRTSMINNLSKFFSNSFSSVQSIGLAAIGLFR